MFFVCLTASVSTNVYFTLNHFASVLPDEILKITRTVKLKANTPSDPRQDRTKETNSLVKPEAKDAKNGVKTVTDQMLQAS